MRIGEVVLSADDICNAHLDVIANDGEVIERVPVGAQQHKVLGLGIIAFLQAENAILKRGFTGLAGTLRRIANGSPAAARAVRLLCGKIAIRVIPHVLVALSRPGLVL